MEVLSVRGGAPLRGTAVIHGAKNSVLPILAACVLCRSPCVLHHCPNIDDVHSAMRILQYLGCRAERSGGTICVDATYVDTCRIPQELAGTMRSSIIFLGAILSRLGCAELALPGGCPLGARPINLHIEALRQMGAVCDCSPECVCCSAGALHEAVITLPFPSVGATENAILAALGCAGSVEIQNAAREPEITDLVRFLQSAGAKISGVGTAKLTVCGGTPLHGTTYTIMPDRIETASFLCAVAGCGGDVTLLRTQRATSEAVCQILEQCECQITEGCDTLRICADRRLRAYAGTIVTAPYPGFPTDAQAPMMAALLRAEGESRICETIFENRFHHVPQLRKLGADIALCGQTACVRAVEHLHGAAMHAEDLRGAMALVIGALQSEEESTITGIKHLRRGYDNLEENLRALGADIKCMEIC